MKNRIDYHNKIIIISIYVHGVGYLTVTLYSFALIAVMKIQLILSNPLGRDDSDLPCDHFLNYFEGSL